MSPENAKAHLEPKTAPKAHQEETAEEKLYSAIEQPRSRRIRIRAPGAERARDEKARPRKASRVAQKAKGAWHLGR
jgi:hypothetical protein